MSRDNQFSEKKGWLLLYAVLILLMVSIVIGQVFKAFELDAGSTDIEPVKTILGWILGLSFITVGWIVLDGWKKYLAHEKASGKMTREREKSLIIKILIYFFSFVVLMIVVINSDIGRFIYQITKR